MSRLSTLAILASLGIASIAAGPQPAVAATTDTVQTITASNWKFAPAEITVHVNEPVTLKLVSGGGVHGFQSDELGIPQTTIAPGGAKTVTFTPKKTGTYVIHCALPCGPGHNDMALAIKVVA